MPGYYILFCSYCHDTILTL